MASFDRPYQESQSQRERRARGRRLPRFEEDDRGAWASRDVDERDEFRQREPFEPREYRLGRFAGRGPKGYQRSDERLKEEVCDRLTADAEVDASELTVSVRAGEVTLEGSVPDRHMKRDAEDCAESISGVRQVHNRLRVEPSEGDERRGGETAAGVAGRYASAAEGQRSSPSSRKTTL